MGTASKGEAYSKKVVSAQDRERRTAIVLSFVVGALVGLVVVAFILLTGRLAARM